MRTLIGVPSRLAFKWDFTFSCLSFGLCDLILVSFGWALWVVGRMDRELKFLDTRSWVFEWLVSCPLAGVVAGGSQGLAGGLVWRLGSTGWRRFLPGEPM